METKRKMRLLGGEIEIAIYGADRMLADIHLDELYGRGLEMQKIFNFFDPKSELSRLNRKRKLEVSQELKEVLEKATEYCRMTNGNYDVCKGREFLQRKQKKSVQAVSCSYKDIKIDGNFVSLGHTDALVDLGSIAKGYIGDKLAEQMQEMGIESGFINLRGDMRIYGEHKEIVEVQHPRDKEKRLCPFFLENMAVATSGDYNQYDMTFEKCHILGRKDIISASVIANTLMEADAAATSIFVMGAENAKSFLSKNPSLRCMAIDSNLALHFYNGFNELSAEARQ